MFRINRKNNLFNTIFIYFIWAIISAFIFLLLTNTYYLNVLQSKTREAYNHKLKNLSKTIETTLEEIHHTTAMFSISNDLENVLTTNRGLKYDDFTNITQSVDALQKFHRTKSYINSVFIINKKDNLIISSSGTSSINEYFNLVCHYDDYPRDFWLELEDQQQKYTIFSPSYVTNTVNGNRREIIPIVQFSSPDTTYNNLLVVNLDNPYMVNLFNENRLSNNSIIFLYNNADEVVIRSDSSITLSLTDKQMIQMSESILQRDVSTIHIEGRRYLVVTNKNHQTNNAICAITPYSDLTRESFSVLMVPLILFFIGIVIVILLSFLFSRKIYTPIHSVALRLRENYKLENDTPIRNDLDFLNQSVQRIINDNKKLKEDLHLAIPYVCERYLLSLFDDNEILREDDVTHFLSHYDFTFPNKFFIVIHSTLNFQEGFFETHSKAEYNAICQGSFLIANEAFSTIENRYVFSVAVNQICVILNIPTPSEKSKLAASILKYHKSLDVNDDMMIVHSGVGNLYEGLNGLKKSYNEARQANSQIIYMTTSMVRTYSPQDENITSSHYSIEEDNQMINFLLQGNKEKVLTHYDRIINKNIEKHIGCHGLKELYLQLYNTAVRVINRKHLNIYDIMGEDYINISSQVGELPVDDLYHYIKKVFLKTIDLYAKSNEVHDIANIKQYLDTHYNHEIYLDAIAEHFGKSAKYMSKYIKKVLGISFQDYISSLRIEKSKELLLNTKNSISSIAEEVGFNSRHPFIRKFKILEGVTPTEYRKLHR